MRGNLDPPPARQVVGRDGPRLQDVVESACGDDFAAPAARAGADIDDEIGGAHHVLVVLDDDHRVACVAQLLEAADQPPVVALVQPDRRLVENVEHIDQLRTDLRGQPDALALAARKRTRRARQRQVAQPHVHQEAQPLADLLDNFLRDTPLLLGHPLPDTGHPLRKIGDRHGRHFGDILSVDAELQGLLPQARTAADGALAVDEELVAPLLAALRVLVLRAADVLGDALPLQELPPARGAELRKIDRQRLRIAVQHGVQPLFGETRHGIVEREVITAAQHLQHGEEQVVAVLAQRLHGPFAQRQPRIGDDLLQVEDRLLAQAVAMGTGALRRVEREGVRRGVLESDARRRTHQVARIETLLLRPVVIDGHRALALPHGLAERGHKPLGRLPAHDEPVHHQVDRMDLVAVQSHPGRDFAYLAVDARIDVTLSGQGLEQLAVVALAALHHGRHDGDAPPGEAREDQLGDPLVGVVHHLLARDGRIGARGAGVEQTQEIVDLGDGPHRRAGILVGRLLFDGHHGAQPRDLIHVGALHRPDELPGVGRKGLHVAALPLGIDRIEGQRRFSRARKARDDHQLAARNLEVHVLEVMDPGAVYLNRVFHRSAKRTSRRRASSDRGRRARIGP